VLNVNCSQTLLPRGHMAVPLDRNV